MKKHTTLLIIFAILISTIFLPGCGQQQNQLVGTWTVHSIDGSTKGAHIGRQVTFSESGKVYDTDGYLSWAFNDEFSPLAWEVVSNGTIVFSGMFGDSGKASYSLEGNTLSLTNRYGTTVFKKT